LVKIKLIDNISGLQLFQLLRFATFLIISIVFTNSHLTQIEIGAWEMFLFAASLLSFFWVTGVIQSLLPLYHRNRTYRKLGDNGEGKSPELFNAFIILTVFSALMFIAGHSIKGSIDVYGFSGNDPYINLLLLYILLSNPVCLVEYIYLLNNRSYRIFQYGIYTFIAQLVLVLLPIIMHKDIIWSIYGLLIVAGVRWVWLIILLRRYTEMKISVPFIKEHLYLGGPLILSSLISGSGQYIDGLIITTWYDDPAVFAIFRYGAKEFPLVMMLASGLSNAMLSEFSTRSRMSDSLKIIRQKSEKLMHILFPSAILMLFISKWLFLRMFTPDFTRSADIFMIYLLLIIPRLIFPQTILIGRKKTRITLIVALIEQAINIPLSLYLIKDYGIAGVALATVMVYTLEKIFLAGYIWVKMKIRPSEYIPVKVFLIYSAIISILFILIDHRIIDVR
jgi:O-antigen/teichoic acid export membrane protein